jgi:hypothetical protein
MQTPTGALAQSVITAPMKHHSLSQQSPLVWHGLPRLHWSPESPESPVAGASVT